MKTEFPWKKEYIYSSFNFAIGNPYVVHSDLKILFRNIRKHDFFLLARFLVTCAVERCLCFKSTTKQKQLENLFENFMETSKICKRVDYKPSKMWQKLEKKWT